MAGLAGVGTDSKVLKMPASFSTPIDGRVVQITKDDFHKKQKISVVDEEAMEKVFGRKEIANSPVAIYCIAGMLRRGKSFFLDLVIRYLKFKVKLKNDSWLDDKTAKINEGFEWRGGSVAHTKGILIWSEPFWIETAQHGKVAVFLMDTQGVGDDSSSPKTDANLFSLASLLSSYLIFNMKDVMNRNDLNQLKTFTDFGEKLKIKKQEIDQTLLFLMRDWQDPEFDYGFEGGKGHLEKTFEEATGASAHYKLLCENIKRSFKEVKCALLPHPGKKFVRMKTTPTLADVDADFLEEIDNLLNDMFSNLCVKKIGKNPLNGTDVINQAVTFSKHMKNVVDADILLEILCQSIFANLIGRCEEKFAEGTRGLGKEYRTNGQLREFHKNLVDEVITHYDKRSNVAPEEKMAECRDLLHKSLQERFFVLENMNEVNEQEVQRLYRSVVNEALVNFEKDRLICLEVKTEKYFLNENELEDKTKQYVELAINYFEDTVKKKILSLEASKQYHQKLENELNVQKKLLKLVNFVFSYEVDKEILKADLDSTDYYKEQFKKGGYPQEEYDEWFIKLEEESLNKYESANVNKSLPEFESGKIKLKTKLSELALIYKEAIDIERAAKDAAEVVVQMTNKTKNEFEEKTAMDSMVDLSKEERGRKYKNIKDDMLLEINNDLKTNCEKTIFDLFENLRAEKEFELQVLQDKFLLELLTIKVEVAKNINVNLTVERSQSIWERITFAKVGTRLDQLNDEKDKSMELFSEAAIGTDGFRRDLVSVTKNSLNDFFNLAAEIAKAQIDVQNVGNMEATDYIQKTSIMCFTEEMNEMLKNTRVRKSKREDFSHHYLKMFKASVEKKFGSSTTSKDAIKTFKKKMEEDLPKWRSINKFHKKYYPRQLGRLAEKFLSLKNTLRGLFESNTPSTPKKPIEWSLSAEYDEQPAESFNGGTPIRYSKKDDVLLGLTR